MLNNERNATTLVILLGASEFENSPNLPSDPSFAGSNTLVHDYFLNPDGFGLRSEELILNLFDSTSNNHDMIASISSWLDAHITPASETESAITDLIVHYVGHGGFKGDSRDYYLAIRTTVRKDPYYTSIPIDRLASTLREDARHLRKYL